MTARCFLDTNVLVYAARGKREHPRKFVIANGLIQNESFSISAQVLQEFYVAAQKPDRSGISTPLGASQAAQWVGWLEPFCEVVVDALLVQTAIDLARRHRISYWDAAVLAAASRASVSILFTEDLNHQQVYDGVQVINPFLLP